MGLIHGGWGFTILFSPEVCSLRKATLILKEDALSKGPDEKNFQYDD